jgi:hypothetical protein
MFGFTWRNWRRQLSRSLPRRARLAVEQLEDRTLLSNSIPLSMTAWTDIGPAPLANGQVPGNGPVSGRIAGLATDPTNANIIYAATAGGGVWKTVNAGVSWTPLTDHLTDSSNNPIPEFMGAVAVAPSNPQVVYAGTGEANNSAFPNPSSYDSFYGEGILVSTDGGKTWTLTAQAQLQGGAISRIAVDPQNANIAYAAVSNFAANGSNVSTGIYKTTNGGGTWTNVTAANGQTSTDPWSDVVIDPTTTGNKAVLFAAVGNIAGTAANGVYESTDGGTTWTLVGGGLPSGASLGRISLAISHPSGEPNATLYASIAQVSFNGGLANLERSTDGGVTWVDVTANLGGDNYLGSQGGYDNVVNISPTNSKEVFVAGVVLNQSTFVGGGILETQDGGKTWQEINKGTAGNNGPHTDYHALAFDASNRLVVGNDGGVWRLDSNDLVTPNVLWTDLNTNLEITQFRGLSLDQTNPNIAYAGSQDNGTEKFNDSRTWNTIAGGDGGLTQVDPTNTQIVYHTFFNANIEISTDGGATFSDISGGLAGNPAFVSPYEIDPNNHNRLLFGTNQLYVTPDMGGVGGDWTPLGVAPNGNTPINSIAIAPTNSNTIYVSSGGSVFVTTDNAASWTNITPPFTIAANSVNTSLIRSIAVDPSNSQIAYATVSAFTTGGGRVFQTTNGGASWTDITANLPNFPVWSVAFYASMHEVLVGTDVGVYASGPIAGAKTNWSQFATGLPNAQVVALEIDPAYNIIAATTHGRGAFETQPCLTINGDQNFPNENDTILVQLDPKDPTKLEAFVNGVLQFDDIASLLSCLMINGGGGNDTINIRNIPANITATVMHPATGVDVINVGTQAPNLGGDLTGIQGPLAIIGLGKDTLNLDSTTSTSPKTGTLNPTSIGGLGMGPTGITFKGLAALNLTLGPGATKTDRFSLTKMFLHTLTTSSRSLQATQTNPSRILITGNIGGVFADYGTPPNYNNTLGTISLFGTYGPFTLHDTFLDPPPGHHAVVKGNSGSTGDDASRQLAASSPSGVPLIAAGGLLDSLAVPSSPLVLSGPASSDSGSNSPVRQTTLAVSPSHEELGITDLDLVFMNPSWLATWRKGIATGTLSV